MTGNITALGINASSGAPAYPALVFRQALAALIGNGSTRTLGTNSGYSRGRTPVLSVTTTTYSIGPFCAVIDPAATNTQAPYLCAVDATQTGSINAAPSAPNSRVDILYAQVSDEDVDSSGLRTFTINYLAGTAANPGVAPSLPVRSFLLASINVPNSGSPTIAINNSFAAASGGVLSVANLAAAPGTPAAGDEIYTLDTELKYFWTGSAWKSFAAGVLAVANSPGHTGLTTTTILTSVTPTLIAGRKYRVNAYAEGTQVSATGTVLLRLAGTSGVPTNILYLASTVAGNTVYGSSVGEITPPTTGSYAFQIVGSTSAGTLTDSVNTQISVEDIGTS